MKQKLSGNLYFLFVFLLSITITACGGGGGGSDGGGGGGGSDGGGGGDGSGSGGGNLLFSVTSNPSTGNDWANNIAIDSTYMYIAGSDNSSGDEKWRIEKRNLSDGALAASFGAGGVVTSNPSTGNDWVLSIAIDSTYMYVVGWDSSPVNAQWRIEKRSLTDGSLVAGFGTGGVITSNPSTGNDWVFSIAIDSTYMYVVGWDSGSSVNSQWRIEKRSLTDGSLVAGFGTGGVVTSTIFGAGYDIAIDSTYMYVVGWDSSPGNYQWRIEKRNLSDGALAASFGAGGVVTSNPSTGDDSAYDIAIDSTYMYVVGWDSSPGNYQWCIEKRNLSDGALVSGFGTGGVVTNNPSTGSDWARSIAIDSIYMYVGGFGGRIEKRSLSDGSLISGFGTGGVVSSAIDEASAIVIDSTYMYVVGGDSSPGNAQWRIEKRTK